MNSGKRKNKKLAVALGVSLTSVSILVLVLGFLFQRTYKKRKQSVLNITGVWLVITSFVMFSSSY